MRATVLLFDIDGTLVSAGGAGRTALNAAFEHLYGRPDACDHIEFGGMTDPAIVRLGLEALGQEPTEAKMDALMRYYLDRLSHTLQHSSSYRVLAGVSSLLHQLQDTPNVALGLGTGNHQMGAALKLRRGGIDHFFSFGGYGSDHELRDRLLAVGAERGAAALGAAVDDCRVVVIGDTPRDVLAAKAIGSECLAVATGGWTAEQLRAHQPHWVLETLEDPSALALLLS